MSLADKVLAVNDDLSIRTDAPVHSGKVRSVYWLTAADSERLIASRGYDVAPDAPLAIMVISDRISAFDCIWHGEGGMNGVPGKGAALNAIVQKARPVMIEAIARQYITGSMWRSYERGERSFCGISIPDGLKRDQKLPELLITPSTKGILEGIPGVPAADDVNITRDDIIGNFEAFKFSNVADVDLYERLLQEGFAVISDELAKLDQIFVDTKFEFGYVTDANGEDKLIYMDEVGTPDSSRIWDGPAWRDGKVVENSKEGFRQLLLNHFPDPDILLNKDRMPERQALARDNALPTEVLMAVSETYVSIAEKITEAKVTISDNPKAEIIEVLGGEFALVD
jgi:phosphoribosylaminoimidazole-succinocarboxamide synthase